MATQARASDIHIEPYEQQVKIRFRIDGVLHTQTTLPKRVFPALVSRLKIMADMDISNPNIPHDGRIKFSGDIGDLDIRVSTFPTHLGESVVMRLLVYNKVVGDLNNLGFEADDLACFKRHIERPYGLMLTTGPTGSGKTTIAGLAASFLNPTKGMVTADGVDLSTVTLESYRSRLGVVLQENFLFDGTIADNVSGDGTYVPATQSP